MKVIGVGSVILAVVLQAGVASAQSAGRHAGTGKVGAHLAHDGQVLDPNDPRVAGTAGKIDHAVDHAKDQGQQIVDAIDNDAALIAQISGLPADAEVAAIEQAVKNDLAKQEKNLTAYAESHAGDWIAKGESIDGVLQGMSTGVTASQHPRVPQNILDEIKKVAPHDAHFEATVAQIDGKLDTLWTEADKARHLQQQVQGAGAIAGILTGLPISGAIGNINAIADAELKKVEHNVAQHLSGIAGAIGAAGAVAQSGLITFENDTRDRTAQGSHHYGASPDDPQHKWTATGDHTFGGDGTMTEGYPGRPTVDLGLPGKYSHTIFNGGYEHNIIGFGKEHQVFGYGDPNGLNHATLGYQATGSLGYDVKGNAGYAVDSNHIEGQAGADVFVGAKAGVQETFDYSVCGIDISGKGVASANAGAGADIGGHFSIDWSHMSVSVGGNIGATLGVGADVSGEVTVSLGGVFQHPGQALGCVFDGVKKLGEFALKAGEKLVTAAYDVGKKAVTTVAKGAVAVGKAVGNAAKSVVSGIGHALGGLFGHKKKKKSSPPPAPAPVNTQLKGSLLALFHAKLKTPLVDRGFKMPEGDIPTDLPMAGGDEGANVGRDAATMPNDTNGWGYGANAYTQPENGTPGAAGTGTRKSGDDDNQGYLAR